MNHAELQDYIAGLGVPGIRHPALPIVRAFADRLNGVIGTKTGVRVRHSDSFYFVSFYAFVQPTDTQDLGHNLWTIRFESADKEATLFPEYGRTEKITPSNADEVLTAFLQRDGVRAELRRFCTYVEGRQLPEQLQPHGWATPEATP